MTSKVGERVVVIGGGLAGIAASLKLAQSGYSVELLETKSRLGGRAGSFTSANGESVDYCQHVGMGCCTELRKLIGLLDQTHAWDVERILHFYGPSGHHQQLQALPAVPAPYHLANWLLRWPGLSLSERFSIATALMRLRRLTIDDRLDAVSMAEWLSRSRQSPNSIDRFWSTILVSALGEQTDRVSLAASAKVLQDGFLNDRAAYHLLVPNRPLDLLFNELAQQKLRDRGVRIRTSFPVRDILLDHEEHQCLVRSKEHTIAGNHVVLAVPWNALSKISLESKHAEWFANLQQSAASLSSAPITGLHTWWDRQWLPTQHAAIVGRMCQWVFPKPEAPREGTLSERSHYYQVVISASYQLSGKSDQEIAFELQEDLSKVFPSVENAQLLKLKTVTDRNAVFSPRPGSLAHRPPTDTPHPRLWLAGDWVRTGWPSTMESAIRSGFQAAERISARNH